MDRSAQDPVGLHPLRHCQRKLTSPPANHRIDLRESTERSWQVQPVARERQTLSSRPGICVAARHPLSAGHEKSYRRRSSDALAPPPVGTGRNQRPKDFGRDQGHGRCPLLRPGDRRFHCRPTRSCIVPLPPSAAHGLWFQSPVSVRLRDAQASEDARSRERTDLPARLNGCLAIEHRGLAIERPARPSVLIVSRAAAVSSAAWKELTARAKDNWRSSSPLAYTNVYAKVRGAAHAAQGED